MKEQIITHLRDARAKIESPAHWIQGRRALTTKGRAWSALGAIMYVLRRHDEMNLRRSILEWFAIANGIVSDNNHTDAMEAAIQRWNDDPQRTHADVLVAFAKTIALVEEEAQEP